MKYFARQRVVTDYPHNGELMWGIVDTRGGFLVCRNEESAKAEAMIRNAQLREEVENGNL